MSSIEDRAEGVPPPHPGPAGEGALRQFVLPTASLLIDASRHPAGAVAVTVMVLLSLGFPIASARAAEVGFEIDDYVLFGLFAAAALFLYVVLRIADRGDAEAPEVEAEAVVDVAPVVRTEMPATSSPARIKATCWLELADERLGAGDQALGGAALQRARDAFAALGDRAGEAQALRRLAHLSRLRGELRTSRELYGEARTGFHAAGDRYGEASCLVELGRVDRDLGEYHTACDAFGDARKLFAGILRGMAGIPGPAVTIPTSPHRVAAEGLSDPRVPALRG